jgi:hypothetical protein
LTDYTAGVLMVLLASTVWVFYALGQKQLLTVWNSLQVMMVIYLFCALLLTPWVHPLEALQLSPLQGWLLLACCMNTLVAYGALPKRWRTGKPRGSVRRWRSRLGDLCAVALAAWWWPVRACRDDQWPGLWRGGAGGAGVGAGGVGAFSDCRAQGPESADGSELIRVIVHRGQATLPQVCGAPSCAPCGSGLARDGDQSGATNSALGASLQHVLRPHHCVELFIGQIPQLKAPHAGSALA